MRICCLLLLLILQSCQDSSDNSLDELLEKLKSQGPTQKFTVVEEIGRLGERANKAIPFLEEILRDSKSSDRLKQSVIDAFVNIHSEQSLISSLQALHDKDWKIRLYAVKKLDKWQNQLVPVIPQLVQALKDPNSEVRDALVEILSHCGESVVEHLRTLANDQAWQVRKTVAESLETIQSLRSVKTLKTLFLDEDWRVRMAAIKALGKLTTQDPSLFHILLLYNESDQRVLSILVETIDKALSHVDSIAYNEEITEVLMQRLLNSKVWKDVAIKTLVKLKTPQVITGLLEHWPQATEQGKQNIVEILEKFSSEQLSQHRATLENFAQQEKNAKCKQKLQSLLEKIQK